jgi:hypothetical protein
MPAPGSLIDDVLPRHDARTVQQLRAECAAR